MGEWYFLGLRWEEGGGVVLGSVSVVMLVNEDAGSVG